MHFLGQGDFKACFRIGDGLVLKVATDTLFRGLLKQEMMGFEHLAAVGIPCARPRHMNLAHGCYTQEELEICEPILVPHTKETTLQYLRQWNEMLGDDPWAKTPKVYDIRLANIGWSPLHKKMVVHDVMAHHEPKKLPKFTNSPGVIFDSLDWTEEGII